MSSASNSTNDNVSNTSTASRQSLLYFAHPTSTLASSLSNSNFISKNSTFTSNFSIPNSPDIRPVSNPLYLPQPKDIKDGYTAFQSEISILPPSPNLYIHEEPENEDFRYAHDMRPTTPTFNSDRLGLLHSIHPVDPRYQLNTVKSSTTLGKGLSQLVTSVARRASHGSFNFGQNLSTTSIQTAIPPGGYLRESHRFANPINDNQPSTRSPTEPSPFGLWANTSLAPDNEFFSPIPPSTPRVMRSVPHWPSSSPSQKPRPSSPGDKLMRFRPPPQPRTVVLQAAGESSAANGLMRFPQFDDVDSDQRTCNVVAVAALITVILIGAFMALTSMIVVEPSSIPIWRLSKDVLPMSYDLRLSLVPGDNNMIGRVGIALNVTKPTKNITLHSGPSVFIEDLSIDVDGDSIKPTWTRNSLDETLRIIFNHSLAVGSNYILIINYNTTIGDVNERTGFFSQGGNKIVNKHWVGLTDFKPCKARLSIPAFDEPGFLATFKLSITIPVQYSAVSNTRVVQILPAINRVFSYKTEMSTHVFERTPRISPHLFAFGVHDLDRIFYEWSPTSGLTHKIGNTNQINIGKELGLDDLRGDDPDAILVSVFHRRGKATESVEALRIAVEKLNWLSEWTGVKLPLKKLDLVPVAGLKGSVGGLGLMFFDDSLLLGLLNSESKIMELEIANQLALQWFGGYSLIEWWDDLWLTEGISYYLKYLSTITTPFNILHQQLIFFEFDGAFEINNPPQATTYQITRPIVATKSQTRTPQQIASLFDPIIFKKTATVLRMLNSHFKDTLGDDIINVAIKSFISRSELKFATTGNFLSTLPSSIDFLSPILGSWLNLPGHPVVIMEESAENETITISQELYTEWTETPTPHSYFHIPITIQTSNDTISLILTGPIKIPIPTTLLLNGNSPSAFRIQYPPSPAYPSPLGPIATAQVISNAITSLQSNRATDDSLPHLLSTLPLLKGQNDPELWKALTDPLLRFSDHVHDPALNHFLANLLPIDDPSIAAAQFMRLAVEWHHNPLVDWALNVFRTLVSHSKIAVAPDVLPWVYVAAMRYSGDNQLVFDVVASAIDEASLPGDLLSALFATPVSKLQHRALAVLDERLLDGKAECDGVIHKLRVLTREKGGAITVLKSIVVPWWAGVDDGNITMVAKCVSRSGVRDGGLEVARLVEDIAQRIEQEDDWKDMIEIESLERKVSDLVVVNALRRGMQRAIATKRFRAKWKADIVEWAKRH
ncbi:hypothetical protein HK096_005688 [Nowakowskiella sp. JEL0078]|nr:hypothetical protein HK096_005688 [Nowakowskiella sp. JEL0078]